MWSSRMFWKLFLVSAGLIVLAVGTCVFVVSRWQEDLLLERVRARSRENAEELLKEYGTELLTMDRHSLQERIEKVARYTDSQVSVMDSTGRVLADSAQESLSQVDELENQIHQKDIVQARRSGTGESTSVSTTGGGPSLHFALAVRDHDEVVGFIRIGRKVQAVTDQVTSVKGVMATVGFGVTLAGLLAAYWLTARLVSPIQQLTEAAEAIAAGDFRRRIPAQAHDEFGMLARSFTRMSEQLAARESQLKESVERHTTVLSGMAEGVLAVDSDLKVLFANSTAGEKLKFNPDKVAGLPLLEVVRSHELREIITRCQKENRPVESEVAWQQQGRSLSLHVRAAPLASGSLLGVVLVLQDVSEIKRLEGIRQQFVSNVSHELKTPLSSIKAYTETLLNGDLADKQHVRHFLSRIDEQATRLNELILDLLSLARIETGQATMEIGEIDLLAAIDRVLDSHEPRAAAAGIQLVRPDATGRINVLADEESLRQIVDNLIDNAIKYTPPDGTITVRCSADGSQACIEVTDTGCGIAPEHHARLFERFYRVDRARSRELGGTGLGLSIVKHLCQAMQGSVSMTSRLGHGSTFAIRLPLAQGETANLARSAKI